MTIGDFVEDWMDGDLEKYRGNIRLHGNGFIQLDIGEGERLHVWSDDLPPAQRVNTAIHDHRFDFVSRVLCGTLINMEYNFKGTTGGEFWLYRPVARRGENTELELSNYGRGDMTLDIEVRVPEGHEYFFGAGRFHDTKWDGLTATYFRKTATYHSMQPRVACPADLRPDNDFDRYGTSEADLWPFVDRAVEKMIELKEKRA